jgi:hypothetical protein
MALSLSTISTSRVAWKASSWVCPRPHPCPRSAHDRLSVSSVWARHFYRTRPGVASTQGSVNAQHMDPAWAHH